MIKEPNIGNFDNIVDHLNRSDSLRISLVEDPITCFDNRDNVHKSSSMNDMCFLE